MAAAIVHPISSGALMPSGFAAAGAPVPMASNAAWLDLRVRPTARGGPPVRTLAPATAPVPPAAPAPRPAP